MSDEVKALEKRIDELIDLFPTVVRYSRPELQQKLEGLAREYVELTGERYVVPIEKLDNLAHPEYKYRPMCGLEFSTEDE